MVVFAAAATSESEAIGAGSAETKSLPARQTRKTPKWVSFLCNYLLAEADVDAAGIAVGVEVEVGGKCLRGVD